MVKVAGVKFNTSGEIYLFDPGKLKVKLGDCVIVETSRGIELGLVAKRITEVEEKDLVKPLKKIIRIANQKDVKTHKDNLSKKKYAFDVCKKKIIKHDLDMQLVDVEYTFDKSKIIFYFTADGRVDFRELVKDLAATFKMRIELRQVGVRDEARLMGGIGICGKSICCNSWLTSFQPVSIKMAKVQNLSLNPTKISGVCGRLMCCLKYENDIYMELRKDLPEVGEKIKTTDGKALVIENNILKGQVKAKLINGKNDDGSDRLSNEILTYDKNDVTRIGKKNNKNKFDNINDEIPDDIRNIIKE